MRRPDKRRSRLAALMVGSAAAVIVVVALMAYDGGHPRNAPVGPSVAASQGPLLLTSPVPSQREGSAMAYDEFRHEVVLFGGATFGAGSRALNDTWTFQGRRWTERNPLTRPGPLFGGQMVYDAQSHRCLLIWAPNGAGPAVTWGWDGSTWSRLANVPLGGSEYLAAIAADPTSGHALLISDLAAPDHAPAMGTHTWTWDGQVWTLRHPATPFPVVPSGGSGPTAVGIGAGSTERLGRGVLAVFADGSGMQTWLWDGSTWTQRGVGAAPPYDQLSATMAEDPGSDQVVLIGLGGNSGSGGSTWVWDGHAWRESGAAPAIDSLYRGTTALTDSRSGHAIVIGDNNPDGRPNHFDELWTFNGHAWVSDGSV